jgi:hypothetical protein
MGKKCFEKPLKHQNFVELKIKGQSNRLNVDKDMNVFLREYSAQR